MQVVVSYIAQFLCVGGSVRRMEAVAQFMMRELGLQLPVGQRPVNIISDTDRYAMFKVGPVLTVSVSITAVDEI